MRSKERKKSFWVKIISILSSMVLIVIIILGLNFLAKNVEKENISAEKTISDSWINKQDGYIKNSVDTKKLDKIGKRLNGMPLFILKSVHIVNKKDINKLKDDYNELSSTILLQEKVSKLFAENPYKNQGIIDNPYISDDFSDKDISYLKIKLRDVKDNKWKSTTNILVSIAEQQYTLNNEIEDELSNLKKQTSVNLEDLDKIKNKISLVKNPDTKKKFEEDIANYDGNVLSSVNKKVESQIESLKNASSKLKESADKIDSQEQSELNELEASWQKKFAEQKKELAEKYKVPEINTTPSSEKETTTTSSSKTEESSSSDTTSSTTDSTTTPSSSEQEKDNDKNS